MNVHISHECLGGKRLYKSCGDMNSVENVANLGSLITPATFLKKPSIQSHMKGDNNSNLNSEFRLYCRDVGRHTLLTRDQFAQISERMYHEHVQLLEVLLKQKKGREYLADSVTYHLKNDKYVVHTSAPRSLEEQVKNYDKASSLEELAEEIFIQGANYWLRDAAKNYLADHPRINGTPSSLELIFNQVLSDYQLLVNSNLRLVIDIAKEIYWFMRRKNKPSLMNMIQEGNIGLLRAVDKFDYRRGYTIATYATWWIKQGIGKSVHQDLLIPLPDDFVDDMLTITSAQEKLLSEGSNPYDIQQLILITKIRPKRVERILNHSQRYLVPLSLDYEYEDDHYNPERTLGERMVSEEPNPEQICTHSDLRKALESAMSTLKEKEREVLRLRFFNNQQTLESIGVKYELTRERIRQIEAKALKKLRKKPDLRRYLRE